MKFGTPDTHGYLFYFAFQGRKLYLRLFHGLADGRGSLAFLTTVLTFYVKETQQVRLELPVPDSFDDVPVAEQVLEKYADCSPIGRFTPDDHMDEAFRFFVDRYEGCSFPLMIEACEFKGIIRMMVTQVFDSAEVAKIIYSEIAGAVPGTEYKDRGIQIYDRLDLEELEHIG